MQCWFIYEYEDTQHDEEIAISLCGVTLCQVCTAACNHDAGCQHSMMGHTSRPKAHGTLICCRRYSGGNRDEGRDVADVPQEQQPLCPGLCSGPHQRCCGQHCGSFRCASDTPHCTATWTMSMTCSATAPMADTLALASHLCGHAPVLSQIPTGSPQAHLSASYTRAACSEMSMSHG